MGQWMAEATQHAWLTHRPYHLQEEMSVGHHSSQTLMEERKNNSCQLCQKIKGRTKKGKHNKNRESERAREEKWQSCWCCRDQRRACRMEQTSAEKLEHNGHAE